MQIAFVGVKPWEKELVEKGIAKCKWSSDEVVLFEEEIDKVIDRLRDVEVLSVFIYSRIGKKVLDRLPKLKVVATRSTGFDHIDLEECKRRKIVVANVPEYGSATVAEAAAALLFAVAKKTVVANQRVREGSFSPEGLTGVDVWGKTLVVVGVGKIGAHMVRIGDGLGMRVIGVDSKSTVKSKVVKIGKWRKKVTMMSLEKALKLGDFVSLHVPYLPATHHLINKEKIGFMKRGSYLINTSRGSVVEVEALVWGLKEGILAGVGLDVVEEEAKVEELGVVMGTKTSKDDLRELVAFHLLREREDVVFTPHNAFNTKEAIERIIEQTFVNIKGFWKNNKK